MEIRAREWVPRKATKVLPAIQESGSGLRRRQTEVLSGMIVWNLLLLGLLVLAECVEGEGGAVLADVDTHFNFRRSAESSTVKKQAANPNAAKPLEKALSPLATEGSVSVQPKDSDATPESSEEKSGEKSAEEGAAGGGGEVKPTPENKGMSGNATNKDDGGGEGGGGLPSHLPNMSTDAVLRGFYVFVGIGAIILIYIVIKMARLRKRRAAGKYRVLSHSDDQEMFPLAAGEGDDEEIFNAAHHQPRK